MAVQLPLNHLVTDLHRPNETPLEVLENKVTSLSRKATALSVLEKISYVALVALVALVFAVSYNLIVLTGAAPLVMAGMILASPLAVFASIKFAQLGKQYALLAANENRAAQKLREIEHWDDAAINAFFNENQLDINRVNLDALSQVNPQEPKKALIPLIARYKSMKAHVEMLAQKHRDDKIKLEEKFRAKEAETREPIDIAIKQKLRYENQSIHWTRHEFEAIPTALSAATILCLIENPTITDLDINPGDFEISGVGKCVPRIYPERMFGKNNEPRNDDYFFFHPDLHRDSLTHGKIEELQMDPSRLKPVIFR